MLKTMLKKQKEIALFQWVVNVSTIVALSLQCLGISGSWLPYIAYVVIGLSVLCIIINIITKKKAILKRSELIQITKNRMINSTGKIVMFGGDLSWTDDYLDVITKITNNSQVVEIIFPLEKIESAKRSVITRFEKNVQALRQAGAVIYSSDQDFHLRCTLIDVEPGKENEDLCVISSKRVYRDASNPINNKYQVNILENSKIEERALCNSFYRNYCLIKVISTQY